ncbi:succinate dehydrogenase subunit [Perilla frutescens var. hirtella]|uniref:Succinate dehydrogenase subunit n=1 Tax=Perilla frutescens var. hirtella TaxID=608512 RepID=A0AAD4IWI6_PERFH|nr:succinate dehydrogenase subunit [Perilla frutescens var. hirtella]
MSRRTLPIFTKLLSAGRSTTTTRSVTYMPRPGDGAPHPVTLISSQKSNDALVFSRHGFHVEPRPREKALLAEDPSLKRFKSHKQGVRRLKIVGDILTIAVVAGMFILSQQ